MDPDDMAGYVRSFIAGCRNHQERYRVLAFYGGSFTGIEEDLFMRYLEEAKMLVKDGTVHGIKASTRPDMIDDERIGKLKDAGFIELELGAQSMDEIVLHYAGRGHAADDTRKASGMVRRSGMKLGIQIMPGLPGEDRQSYKNTVEEVLKCKPDGVRIYPTVVLAGTPLEKLYRAGVYEPLDLEEAVLRSLYGYIRFTENGSQVYRMGLPPLPGSDIVSGPYHRSFGHLVKARSYRIMVEKLQERFGPDLELTIHPDDVSDLLGFQRENIERLCFSYSFNGQLPRGYVQYKGTAERGCAQPKDIIEYIL